MERRHDRPPKVVWQTVPKETTLATSKLSKTAADFMDRMLDVTAEKENSTTVVDSNYVMTDVQLANFLFFHVSGRKLESAGEAFDGSQLGLEIRPVVVRNSQFVGGARLVLIASFIYGLKFDVERLTNENRN
jgi:hypothetical protein